MRQLEGTHRLDAAFTKLESRCPNRVIASTIAQLSQIEAPCDPPSHGASYSAAKQGLRGQAEFGLAFGLFRRE